MNDVATWAKQEPGETLILRFLPNKAKDKAIVAVRKAGKAGSALAYVSEELRNDKDVVLAAVSNYGYALEYASKELCADKEVVLAAVRDNGYALEYASKELRADKDVVLAAVNNHNPLQGPLQRPNETHALCLYTLSTNAEFALNFTTPYMVATFDMPNTL